MINENQEINHKYCGYCGAEMMEKRLQPFGYSRKTGKPSTPMVTWVCSVGLTYPHDSDLREYAR